MALDHRLHLRQVDPVVHADHLARQIRSQSGSAARALVGTMINDPIGCLAQPAALSFVARLGTTGLRSLLPLFAIGRGRFGGGARGPLWSLQPQHQLDQLLLAQTLKLATSHLSRESALPAHCKGVGNYPATTDPSLELLTRVFDTQADCERVKMESTGEGKGEIKG